MSWDGENMSWDVTVVSGCALPGHPAVRDPLSHIRSGGLDE